LAKACDEKANPTAEIAMSIENRRELKRKFRRGFARIPKDTLRPIGTDVECFKP
jgi:hypothetical protein